MKSPPATLEQLAQLCQNGGWRRETHPSLPSGFSELDDHLPGGGWPGGAIAELMSDVPGIGELSLLIPALSNLARAGRYIVWVAPPYLPYAPALAQRGLSLNRVLLIRTCTWQQSLWATEQALRCPGVGAVLSWPVGIIDRNIRRLQLAAEAGGSLGFLYRPPAAALESSPAALRLRLHPAPAGSLTIEIQKSRGGRAGMRLQGLKPHSHASYSHVPHSNALAVHPPTSAGA
jgi:protein ImuA